MDNLLVNANPQDNEILTEAYLGRYLGSVKHAGPLNTQVLKGVHALLGYKTPDERLASYTTSAEVVKHLSENFKGVTAEIRKQYVTSVIKVQRALQEINYEDFGALLYGETPNRLGISYEIAMLFSGGDDVGAGGGIPSGTLGDIDPLAISLVRLVQNLDGEVSEESNIEKLRSLRKVLTKRDRDAISCLGAAEVIYDIIGDGASQEYKHDSKGKVIRYKNLKRYSHVKKIKKSAFVDPLMGLKLVKKSHVIPYRHRAINLHLLKAILIDDSGSMDCGDKPSIVYSCILHLLTEVRKGYTTLLINCFIGDIRPKWLVFTPDSVKGTSMEDLIKMVRETSKYITFGGGGTNVNLAIENAYKAFSAESLETVNQGVYELPENTRTVVHVPQFVVINDGQDQVIPIPLKGPGGVIAVHCVAFDQTNPDMVKLCELSGGTYTFIK